MSDTKKQIQEGQKTPNRTIPRQIIFEPQKIKDKKKSRKKTEQQWWGGPLTIEEQR